MLLAKFSSGWSHVAGERQSANEEGSAATMIGRINSRPTNVLIAAAVWRMIVARPSANKPRAKR